MKNTKLLPICLMIALTFSFCKKEKKAVEPDPQPSPYYVRMTDAPGPYTAVNVDIQSVVITGNGNNVTLNTNAGIYNLLNLSNGIDTLLATGSLTIDKVQQIRLILGPNNSVVSGGTTYPLTVPSGEESGLKLQVYQTLQAGVAYYVLLDFDANQSIVNEGNGSYKLKPVIRTIESAISGSIKGQIVPGGVGTTITVTSNSVSYSTVANANGEFIIKGLPPGTYSLSAVPASPYNTVNTTNISVSLGITTIVGQLAI